MPIKEWFNLENKVALVIGASQGLGKEIAITFAHAGADVICAARNTENLEKLKKELASIGRSTFAVTADVKEEEQVKGLFSYIADEKGRLDILVYCAGTMLSGSSFKIPLEEWRNVIDTNLTGAFLACQKAGAMMKEKEGGRIILISSAFADRNLPYTMAYMVSKAGLNQMVRALGAEWARYGIRVNGIAPGYFDTEMPAAVLADPVMKDMILKAIPVKRIGRPREIGPLAVYLASEVSDYVNGEIIRIDGGQSL
jgi:NAD(P)-dependent dehydrogenase (short-subunit alcohol dehydrogenase family)